MKHFATRRTLAALVLVAGMVAPRAAALAETYLGSNVDARVLIGFKVDAENVQPFLPEGWTAMEFPGGPLKGANLMVTLIDRIAQTDAEGKPQPPANSRAVAIVGMGKEAAGDGVSLFVYRIYSTLPGYDPYKGNGVMAGIERASTTEGPANEARQRSENWTVTPEGGGELAFSLSFSSGMRGWSPGEAKPRSNVEPDFSRIYRYEQTVDLVMSAPVGKPLAGEFSVSNSVEELAALFDGSQETIAILDVPVYVRKVFLP